MTVLKSILEALAVGDALGMPTEFMTQTDIDRVYPEINGLLDPGKSYTHFELPYGSVTDDTEQNLYLARAYTAAGEITVENSAEALSRWVVECDAVAKKYIGPSSMKALNAIKEGVSPMEAGRSGTTNGGIMRTPSLVLCAGRGDEDHLLHCIRMGCIPTHHTSQAISAAAAYGFALRAILDGREIPEILEAAERGARRAYESVDYVAAAPDCIARLKKIREDLEEDASDERIRHLLFHVYGNGLESIDAFTVAMTVFLAKGKDVFGALKLCASLGGDTDTVGALTGALCAAYAGGHNIPEDILRTVIENNHLDLEEVARNIETTFWQ
ncbi:MAG: hypothetical protein E7431_01640 [Ruminococcaceae bacterium]|nr:hypothetical protein [Oscillospiraceae bacterium]